MKRFHSCAILILTVLIAAGIGAPVTAQARQPALFQMEAGRDVRLFLTAGPTLYARTGERVSGAMQFLIDGSEGPQTVELGPPEITTAWQRSESYAGFVGLLGGVSGVVAGLLRNSQLCGQLEFAAPNCTSGGDAIVRGLKYGLVGLGVGLILGSRITKWRIIPVI